MDISHYFSNWDNTSLVPIDQSDDSLSLARDCPWLAPQARGTPSGAGCPPELRHGWGCRLWTVGLLPLLSLSSSEVPLSVVASLLVLLVLFTFDGLSF